MTTCLPSAIKFFLFLATMSLLAGCDLFISRGGDGQACFQQSDECQAGLFCIDGRCQSQAPEEEPDAGVDGGDPGPVDDNDPADAGDDGDVVDDGDDADPGDDADDADGADVEIDGGDQGSSVPVQIYRSVGPQNTTALASGAGNTLTITADSAIFSNPLPDNVGQGDVIQYDSDGDLAADSLAFIFERDSATEYLVANADGGLPTGTTEGPWTIYRAYTSLTNATSAQNKENTSFDDLLEDFDSVQDKDLIARNFAWNIACYGDAIDLGPVRIEYWGTDATHRLRIFTPVLPHEVGSSQRHQGKWTESAYTLEMTITENYQNVLRLDTPYLHIDGLQITKLGEESLTATLVSAPDTTNLWLSNSILWGSSSVGGTGISVSNIGSVARIWNNVIYQVGLFDAPAIFLAGEVTAYIYNNTLFGNYRGIYVADHIGTQITLINNVSAGNSDYDFDPAASFAVGSSHNCSADDSATLGNLSDGCTGVSASDFTDQSAVDFHLSAGGTLLKNTGADLSADEQLPFANDIDGDPRPAAGWDIGADQSL